MNTLIKVPFLGANDSDCELVEWLVDDGDSVHYSVTICALETTKAAHEIHADFDGYLYQVAKIGQRLEEGEIVGLLASEEVSDVKAAIDDLRKLESVDQTVEKKATKKAEILIKRNHLKLEDVQAHFGADVSRITEDLVNDYLEAKTKSAFRLGFSNTERIGVIGGASGGGALIVVESLLKSKAQQPVAIFDQNPEFHGKSILGVPIAGDIDTMWKWLKEGKLDKVVIAFNRNLDERKKIFDELKSQGVSFCNVVDSSADIRVQVTMGEGNVVLGSAYLGACTEIGDNNFISSNVCLEHGNKLGSHCAFGPAVATSGNVTIGDKVRFGTGIFIEPEVSIGDDVVIASGSVLRSDVSEGAIVKMKYGTSVKSR